MSHIIEILVHVAPNKSFIRDIHLYLYQFDQYQYYNHHHQSCIISKVGGQHNLVKSILLLGCLFFNRLELYLINIINNFSQQLQYDKNTDFKEISHHHKRTKIILTISGLLTLINRIITLSSRSIFLLGINNSSYNYNKNTKTNDNNNNNNREIIAIENEKMKPGPSEIVYKNMRFLILDRPSETTLPQLVEEFKKLNVRDVIRVCEPSYKTDALTKAGIEVHDWQFDDGSPPPQNVIDNWFELLRNRYKDNKDYCMAVHCVAGLGRGPVMVALALMELGMQYEDTIEYIRERRRGAFNQKQLKYLASYKPRSRLKNKKSSCTLF